MSSDRGAPSLHPYCTLTAPLLRNAHYGSLLTAGYLLRATHRSLLRTTHLLTAHLLTAHLTPSTPATQAHSASYLAAVAAAEKAGVIEDGGVVARPHTLGRGDAFGTAALLGEGGVHLEALVAVDTVRACILCARARARARELACACACARACVHSCRLAYTHARTTNTRAPPAVAAPRRPATLTPCHPHPVQVRCLVLDLRCDPNAACRQALRPLRARIRARSERSAARQRRAVIALGALRMVAPLGRGAWARVQLAQHAPSGEAYALKTVSKRELLRRGTLDVVVKERRLVRLCAHPNVVELYTSYQDAESVHLLFEHLPGGELGALLRRDGPLDQPAARFYAACVLSALEAVHDAGVVRSPPRRPARPPPAPLPPRSASALPNRSPHRSRHRAP